MLNEERVKHMTKLAFYETKGGTEEIKISAYYKKEYINFNMWCSIIWMTLAFAAFVIMLGLTFAKDLIEDLSRQRLTVVVIAISIIYLILLVSYIILSRKHYRKKHARAYHRVKRFKQDLQELEHMYEKEDYNGETI